MNQENVRWQQRFSNYKKALARLEEAVSLSRQRPLSQLEKQGLIQGFEFTYELGWNVLRDFLRQSGVQDLFGSRDTIREAFSTGLIEEGEGWIEMLKDRNLTSHAYNENMAEKISLNIIQHHFGVLERLREQMQARVPHP